MRDPYEVITTPGDTVTPRALQRLGRPSRSLFLRLVPLVLSASALLCGATARAQDWPTRPVKAVVGFPPGGAVDFTARMIGGKLGELWGQQVVIENRGGAGSTIGAAAVASAAPDGYTFLVVSPAHTINPSLYKNLPFDTRMAFAPVSQLVSSPLVLYLNPSNPARNVAELIAQAKARPGVLNYGVGGSGTSVHLASVLFNMSAGVDIVNIMYQGGGPALTAILAGDVQLMFGGVEYVNTHVRAGKLKAIAVTTPRATPAFPDLPPVSETVPGYGVEAWYGVYMPAKTPAAVINKFQQDLARVLRLPDVQATYAKNGFTIIGSTPEQFAAFTNAEIEKWRKVVQAANISN